jgi:hypothetical protein
MRITVGTGNKVADPIVEPMISGPAAMLERGRVELILQGPSVRKVTLRVFDVESPLPGDRLAVQALGLDVAWSGIVESVQRGVSGKKPCWVVVAERVG